MKNYCNKPIALFFFLISFSFTYAQEEVQINSEGLALYGTLEKPEQKTDKAILIIVGSGNTNRNGNTMPGYTNNSLKMLAEALTNEGFATLRYDKRAVGKSTTDSLSVEDIRFEDYAIDAANWIAYLKKEYTDVTVIGHSQGGLVGMMAVQKTPADRLISLAGISEDLHTTLKRQLGNQPPMVTKAAFPILDSLQNGVKVEEVPPYLNALFAPKLQGYMMSFMKYDPRKEIQKTQIPTLVIQGDTDLQITVEGAKALSEQSEYATFKKIENMNHVLKESSNDQAENFATYSNPDLPLHKELLPIILEFMRENE